ncbi:Calx-beta domain-containing protein [Arenibacter sp. GZD96]|uniref:beta strand repeat-containing protein n=1 Tax=Aurantibrevibacter litoralis TaxID=3106030 RepID=UPI002AFDDC08|nr:right-handed parallel beta-helix repeat-containing protein [Arenibacter sp. GZD-96]MEA1786788.1 Calx-beta domain-containing protein [Arenibacter sp. GZD-96]
MKSLSSSCILVFVFCCICGFSYSQQTFSDNFSSVSYANNNGNTNFASNWIESGETTSPNNGRITINSNQLRFDDLDNVNIQRSLNLSGAISAMLSFNYNATSRGNESLNVQLWNAVTNSWEIIATLNNSNTGTITHNLTANQISANSAIRFISASGNWSSGEIIFIDNVVFTANIPPFMTVNDVVVNEAGGTAVFTVTHTGFSSAPFTVNYQTVNGSAIAGSDFTFTSGALSFNGTSGATQNVIVPIVSDDIPELEETFIVVLTGSSNPDTNISDTGTGTIASEVVFNQSLILVEQFAGNYDFTSTGGSFRTQPNAVNACAITTTSSNSLIAPIPAGASIQKALLYWAHSSLVLDNTVTFEGQAVTADVAYQSGITDRVFFGYVSDVTTIVNNIPNPSTNVFDVTDLTIDNGSRYCPSQTVLGGWALMVFYTEPTLPAVSINLYRGFDGFSNNGTSFTLDAFFAIGGAGSKASFLSWEGDETLSGASAGSTNPEELSITNQTGTTFVLSGDGGQPGNNAYNSTIYDNTVTPVVNISTTYGMDWDTFDISAFINTTDNQVTANVDVGQDFVISNAVVLKVPSNIITGRVFEDINYPGGPGRAYLASGGMVVPGARVELYNTSGVLVQSTTTRPDGVYVLAGMPNGNYAVRVVNSSIRSNRGGGLGCATCWPVQTFKYNHNGAGLVAVTGAVGGTNPSGQDSPNGVLAGAQTISQVVINSNGISDLDFGFNFNTIVNTNATGQGSLEQFIINSNLLDEVGLNIEANSLFDPASGDDTSIFMIPPAGDALGRPADPNFSNGYFDIFIPNSTSLSTITGTNTKIDGRTQTVYLGNTNAGTIGAGGSTVGISGTLLPNYERPEIQIHRNNGNVVTTVGNNVEIRNVSVFANSNLGIAVNNGSARISENFIGTNALGSNAGAINTGVQVNGGTAIIEGNYIATSSNSGILINGGASTLVQHNHINANGIGSCNDNIVLQNGSGIVIRENLIENTGGIGVEGWNFAGGVTINENTIRNSGLNGGNCSGAIENSGIRLFGNNSVITSNIITQNGGAGIVITGGNTAANRISQNSIYNNGGLGIDIDQRTTGNPTGDGITLNDSGDVDNGPNTSLNFPLLAEAYLSGSNLIVKGWSRPGAILEFFFTDISKGTAMSGVNQFGLSVDYGEGQEFIGSFTENSTSDLDASASAYSDPDGNTDSTNRFQFSIPVPANTGIGELITATATLGNSTSEFSPSLAIKVKTVITNRRITYRVNGN